jgi:HK97 family phage major capsid protein
MGIKQLLQAQADNDAAIRKIKKEGRELSALAERTPEQAARLTAIFATELTALEEKAETLAADLVNARRLQDDERRAPTVPAASDRIQVGHNNAEDRPWGPVVAADASPLQRSEARHLALGNFAMAVRAAAYGQVDDRLHAAATGAGTQIDSNMGFAVPSEIAPGIERDMFETGDLLSRVDARTITIGNTMTYNLIDSTSRADGSRGGGVLGYWVDEGTAPTASTIRLARMELKLRKVGAFGVFTDELLADAVALGGELEASFAEELTFQVENKIWRGNGASAPLGFLVAPCLVSVAKETNQTAATINVDNLTKMWARMPTRSKSNAVWYYNAETFPTLAMMAQAIGTGGTAPRFVNYAADGSMTIFGRPAIESEYAEAVGTVGDIVLIDPKKYRLIRKGGIEQASSMHVYFATGEQAFRAFYRVDGQMVPRAALTPFKGSATLSPVVALATRA